MSKLTRNSRAEKERNIKQNFVKKLHTRGVVGVWHLGDVRILPADWIEGISAGQKSFDWTHL